MKSFLFGLLILFTINLNAQENKFHPDKKYHPDSLIRWTKSVMDETSKKHPGFYRYTSKENFDHLIDSTTQTINEFLTELEYYRKLKPLFAKIGCLHTGISLSTDYQNYLAQTSTFIPLEIFIDSEGRVLISKNNEVSQTILVGSEILSINNKPISQIINKLINSIPSDGYNQTEKTLLLNQRFSFWYQSIIEIAQDFKVEVSTSGVKSVYELKGVSKDVFPSQESLESNYKKVLEFDVTNNVGVLKVHSFAKTVIKANGQNFEKFVKETFNRIDDEEIKILIIDLRYNTGGSDGNAVFLASHFFDKPFRYWEKIEVTEALAKEIKGAVRLIYRKPVIDSGTYLWKKAKLTNEFDYYETQKPARNNFKGKTYILTNGLCMSSCSDFTAILSQNKKAIVVGQESGGGFQGNTSGIIPTAKIPTGLQVTIPLQKYTNAVDLSKYFGHGTLPDYEVTPNFDDWVNKKDVEMEYVLELIRKD